LPALQFVHIVMIMDVFVDRKDAGEKLAQQLKKYAGRSDTIVLGLPRGGVPVAYEVSRKLNAPLDIYLVRKLGVPGHVELAMGAIASGGVRIINLDVVKSLNIPQEVIDMVAHEEEVELERRFSAYRGNRPPLDLKDKIVILIDDGLATGSSMRAAVTAVKKMNPKNIVVAVPLAARETCRYFEVHVDEVVCLMIPEPFYGVGYWYRDFSQTSDEEVINYLNQAEEAHYQESRGTFFT